jgi:DNA repair protein RecO (recombination protein O)
MRGAPSTVHVARAEIFPSGGYGADRGPQAPRWYNLRMRSRQRVYSTEGLVLRRHDFGEADRLVTLFTPRFGKIRAVAKGVRRPISRKAGHLEPLTRVKLQLAKGKNLDIITQAEASELYDGLRQDLASIGHANYIVELLDRFTMEREENQAIYQLALATLDRLSVGDPPASVMRYYQLRLLDMVGFRPELFQCLGCRVEIAPEDQYFSIEQGGVLCPRCGRTERKARPISLAGLKVLRHYQRSPYEVAAQARIRPEVEREVEVLMEAYLTYLLERQLNSPTFLRQVRDLERRGDAAGGSA